MRILGLTILAAGLAASPTLTLAQSVEEIQALDAEARCDYMQSLSPEERRVMREQWREELRAMPEDEREAVRDRMRTERDRNRQAREECWTSMSDEEREAVRQQRSERKQERRQRWESMSDEERAAARERRNEMRRQGRRETDPDDEAASD